MLLIMLGEPLSYPDQKGSVFAWPVLGFYQLTDLVDGHFLQRGQILSNKSETFR